VAKIIYTKVAKIMVHFRFRRMYNTNLYVYIYIFKSIYIYEKFIHKGGQNYGHYLDGDGYITRISFANGKAHFMSKFVRTEEYVRESEEGEVLYRRFYT
jgi:hypothetical protein